METTRMGMPKNKLFREIGWVMNRLLGGYRNINKIIDFNGRIMDRINKNSKHLANGVTPDGMICYPAEAVYPLTKAYFEEREYNIPKNYDLYLTTLYGDYMTPPPEDKKAVHYVTAWKPELEDESDIRQLP